MIELGEMKYMWVLGFVSWRKPSLHKGYVKKEAPTGSVGGTANGECEGVKFGAQAKGN